MASLEQRARSVGDHAYKKAADLYWRALEVQADEALGTGGTSKAEGDDAEAATRVLEQRFPSIKDVAQNGPDSWAQSMSGNPKIGLAAESRSRERGRQKSAASTSPEAPARRPRAQQGRHPSRATARAARRGGGRLRSSGRRGVVGRAIQQTGVPGAARSATESALQALGVLVGLSLAYLLLSNAQRAQKGRSAVELIGKGVSNGVKAFVDARPLWPDAQPVTVNDPLAGVQTGGTLIQAARAHAQAGAGPAVHQGPFSRRHGPDPNPPPSIGGGTGASRVNPRTGRVSRPATRIPANR